MLDDVLRNSILVDLTQTQYYRYLQMSEHSGTHMDAPAHLGPGSPARVFAIVPSAT